jgi:hypothetical protein
MRGQFVAPDRKSSPYPGLVDDFLKRSISTPVLETISGPPVPDDHYRFPIVLLQGIVQKSAHMLYDHQNALSMRERLPDAPREFFLYLSNWSTRQVNKSVPG